MSCFKPDNFQKEFYSSLMMDIFMLGIMETVAAQKKKNRSWVHLRLPEDASPALPNEESMSYI